MAQGSKPADLGAVASQCKREVVNLAITNSGSEPGMITKVSLAVMRNKIESHKMDMNFDSAKSVVEASKLATLELRPLIAGRTHPELPRRNNDDCEFRLNVLWQDFKGSSRERIATCVCPD